MIPVLEILYLQVGLAGLEDLVVSVENSVFLLQLFDLRFELALDI